MTPPYWKRWLSYFFEWHIESRSSIYNPHLYVSLKNGRYQLCTANAIYSYADLYDNFTRSFHKVDLDRLPGDEVLILGFGLGSIPIILENVFERKFRYVGVEIDEEVIDLANKYALPDLRGPIQLICTEAFSWIQHCDQQFAMICMDIFKDDEIPDLFQQEAYLEQLKRLLLPGGLLLYNRLAVTHKDRKASQTFLETPFKTVFPEATFWDVGGNYMLVNTESLNHNTQ